VASEFVSENIILNHYSSRRISLGRTHQRFRVYTDYFRRVYWIYLKHGGDSLLSLIKGGRSFIKDIERQLDVNGGICFPDSSRKLISVNSSLADQIALLSLEHEVLSPLALYYCMYHSGRVKCSVLPSLEEKILEELETRTFVVLRGQDGGVEFNDYDLVAGGRWSRFEVLTE